MSALAMTSMQRTLTALEQQEPDRVPLFLLTTMHGAKELGLTIRDYFSRAEHVVEGQMRLMAKYRSDCLMPFFSAALETEAWGGEVIYVADGPPNAGAPIFGAKDIDNLRPPDVKASTCLGRTLTAITELKARVHDSVPIVGVVVSPFSLPVMQMGFEAYLDLIHQQPERFERLMRVNEAFTVAWANAQLDAGATAICYFDPVSSTTIIPRDLYLRTGQQVAKRTMARINGPTGTHLASGSALPLMADLADTGTAIVGVSSMEDMGELKVAAAGRVSLLGNLNGIAMRRWSQAEAETQVKRIIAKAGRGGGLLIGDNHGEIPWDVSEEVLLAIREAVDRWGRYPLNWVEHWKEEDSL